MDDHVLPDIPRRKKRKPNYNKIGFIAGLYPDYYKTQGALSNLNVSPTNKRERNAYKTGFVTGVLAHMIAPALLGAGLTFLGAKFGLAKDLKDIKKLLKG